MPATTMEVKSFGAPEETRPFEDKGQVALVTVAGRQVGKSVFHPGWSWHDHVKPIAGTDSCEFAHFFYVVSGRMRVTLDDGSTVELGPDDVATIPPGHDAEIVGDEPCITIDLGEDDLDYAKPE